MLYINFYLETTMAEPMHSYSLLQQFAYYPPVGLTMKTKFLLNWKSLKAYLIVFSP